MLVLTCFDSFSYYMSSVINLFRKFDFSVGVKHKRASFHVLFFVEFFDVNFCFIMLHKLSKFH